MNSGRRIEATKQRQTRTRASPPSASARLAHTRTWVRPDTDSMCTWIGLEAKLHARARPSQDDPFQLLCLYTSHIHAYTCRLACVLTTSSLEETAVAIHLASKKLQIIQCQHRCPEYHTINCDQLVAFFDDTIRSRRAPRNHACVRFHISAWRSTPSSRQRIAQVAACVSKRILRNRQHSSIDMYNNDVGKRFMK